MDSTMQPNDNHYQPGSELPHPATKAIDFTVPETAKHQPAKAEQASKAAELPQLHPGQQPGSVSQLPTSRLPLAPPAQSPPTVVSQTIPTDAPDMAEDNELIEQEWVHKAKAIVDRTKDNPHLQNQEINKFKADYIKKRYNKEIKVNED